MDISNKNIKLATRYFLGDTTLFDGKDADYRNLFMAYASDSNSSTLREAVTLHFLNYERYPAKHGADGFDTKTGRQKEVKPRYFTAGSRAMLGGNFNDMSMELLEKKQDYDIICSTFIGNRLVAVVEFPMRVIYEKLKKPIIDAKPGKRVVCHFSNTAFQDSDQLTIHYYDGPYINRNNCFSKKTAMLLESKYDSQLSKQKKFNKGSTR
jgi:hypothetical protein